MKVGVWVLRVAVCLIAFSLVVACAKPPTQEMADAEKAIADAKGKGADLYVEDIFAKAQGEMKRAVDMVTAKKYAEAKTAALEAARMAQQAASMVEQNKQKMKEELMGMLPEVQKALDEMKSLATSAIKKKAAVSKDELQSVIGKLEMDMTEAKDQLQKDNVRQAYDLAKSITERVNSQKESLLTAMGQ